MGVLWATDQTGVSLLVGYNLSNTVQSTKENVERAIILTSPRVNSRATMQVFKLYLTVRRGQNTERDSNPSLDSDNKAFVLTKQARGERKCSQ